MARTPAIGLQDFGDIIRKNCFYVDKTAFIKEWWESEDSVTLITRPRRFGKTLTMSMLDYFFSLNHKGDGHLFEGLSIWKEEKYRKLQGTYPVIFLSFASVKSRSFTDAKKSIGYLIALLYQSVRHSLREEGLNELDAALFRRITPDMGETDILYSLNQLSAFLARRYGRGVLIFLDEYDTPMQEAYVNGYWDEMASFIRGMFNATFKTNPYLERAILTGITRISKESIFSDLNNLKVVTSLTNKYETAFGFTEEETFAALEEFGLWEQRDKVKAWYDGFIFGGQQNIYNPWSITNFLDEKSIKPYWANTSSNGLVSELIKKGEMPVKKAMEDLLQGKTCKAHIDQEIVFNRLDVERDAVWSLLLASGYLKAVGAEEDGEMETEYELAVTNFETIKMFKKLISDWFNTRSYYLSDFCDALLAGNVEGMNRILGDILLKVVSYFDTGTEAFYHGLTLGLISCVGHRYIVTSNPEAGLGRCDTLLEPKEKGKGYDGIILEYKKFDGRVDKDLTDTVRRALEQAADRKYSAALEAKGIDREDIKIYGFAFRGKEVLIQAFEKKGISIKGMESNGLASGGM